MLITMLIPKREYLLAINKIVLLYFLQLKLTKCLKRNFSHKSLVIIIKTGSVIIMKIYIIHGTSN